MSVLLLTLLLVLPVAGQTRDALNSRYGPTEGNRYRVKPGIAVEVTFTESGKVQTFRIVPDESKSRKALLRLDDVRNVIAELIPGRLCLRPLTYTEIKVPCPQRKNCKGIQEEWKRATTLMALHKDSVAYALVTLTDELIPPPGNMKLLPDYEHVPGCGIDTSVGYIKKDDGIKILYDIGRMAGNFAIRYASTHTAEWTKTEQVRDDSVLVVLTKDKHIVATFEKAVANFSARVSSQSDIDDFLKIVLTYNPSRN
jgi:hypothetical protein